ncbi:MAG: hypothetical protein JWM53_4522 [bacterium]|nr:hypothetical protein [bacterium]
MRKLMIPIIAAVAAMGCSSGTRTVSGQLDLTQMHPTNAQVVAISSAGHVFRAPIAANGAFSISLPTQASYTIRFANATNVAQRFDAFATLAPRRAGVSTHWFALTSGAAIQLGRVARPGTAAVKPSAGLSTASDGADDGSSDGAGEQGEQEDDGAEACDLSGGADDADVESDHDVNDAVDSDNDGTPDSVDTQDDRSTCGTKSDDGCKLSDDESKELDDDADKSCTAGGGGSTGTPTPTPAPGLAP